LSIWCLRGCSPRRAPTTLTSNNKLSLFSNRGTNCSEGWFGCI
jgi:hypothetical protein